MDGGMFRYGRVISACCIQTSWKLPMLQRLIWMSLPTELQNCHLLIYIYHYISMETTLVILQIADTVNLWFTPCSATCVQPLSGQLEPPVGSRQMVCWHRYGQKLGDPKFDLMACHHFAHSIGNFGSFPNFWERFGLTPAFFFCHLSGHLLLLHAKPGQTWLATASCDTHGISPCHGWLACLRNERPPISVVSLQQILNMLWTILGFWLPLWKRWRTWMKWTPFEPRYPTRKVPCGSLWHNTRYTFGANPCQENHIENQFVLHHHIVLVCHLNNNFLASQPLHTLWNVHECSKSCK